MRRLRKHGMATPLDDNVLAPTPGTDLAHERELDRARPRCVCRALRVYADDKSLAQMTKSGLVG